MNKFEELVAETQREYPGFEIRVSDRVPLYAITLGTKIYVKPKWEDAPWQTKYATLRHERVHMHQQRAMGCGSIKLGLVLFAILYILFPLPIFLAYFRWRWERVAYVESMRAWQELGDYDLGDNAESHANSVAGKGYGWAWPRPLVTRYFKKQAKMLEEDK